MMTHFVFRDLSCSTEYRGLLKSILILLYISNFILDFKVDFKQNVCYMFLCHVSILPSKKIILLYYTSLSVIVFKYFIKQMSNESQFRNFIRSVGCQNA